MASFREMCFTPAEFAVLAKIDKTNIGELEEQGLLRIIKKKVGNVDRKMITLEDMQGYFRMVRESAPADLAHPMGDGAEAAGSPSACDRLAETFSPKAP